MKVMIYYCCALLAKLSIRVYLLFHDFNMSGVQRQVIK